jgi:hypothetical protein
MEAAMIETYPPAPETKMNPNDLERDEPIQDDANPYLLSAAVETAANYAYEERE